MIKKTLKMLLTFIIVFCGVLMFSNCKNAYAYDVQKSGDTYSYNVKKTKFKSLDAAKKNFYKRYSTEYHGYFGQSMYAIINIYTKYGMKKAVIMHTTNTTSARPEEIYFKYKNNVYLLEESFGKLVGVSNNGRYFLSYVGGGEYYISRIGKKKVKRILYVTNCSESELIELKNKYGIIDLKSKCYKIKKKSKKKINKKS